MLKDKLHILVVEDDPLIREDISDCLLELGYSVIGKAGSINQAKKALETLHPDLVLLDIHLEKRQDGIHIAHLINQEHLIPFIYLTAYADDQTLTSARETLPAGYVLKPYDETRLKAAIEIARQVYYAVLQPHFRKIDWLPNSLKSSLTAREQDLLQLISQGYTNHAMAESLSISINTIKTHLKNLYLKLEVKNRTEAILKLQTIT